MWPDGKGPSLIVDDGGDATLFVHKAAEFEKAGKVPAFNPEKDPEEWGVILTALRTELAKNPGKWTSIAKGIRGVSEETTTGVHRLYEMQRSRHADVPGHQRQRLGDQEQVRQHLRLPPLGHRRV